MRGYAVVGEESVGCWGSKDLNTSLLQFRVAKDIEFTVCHPPCAVLVFSVKYSKPWTASFALDLWGVLLEKDLVTYFHVKRLQPDLHARFLIVSSL